MLVWLLFWGRWQVRLEQLEQPSPRVGPRVNKPGLPLGQNTDAKGENLDLRHTRN
jgi:hypothetical protein